MLHHFIRQSPETVYFVARVYKNTISEFGVAILEAPVKGGEVRLSACLVKFAFQHFLIYFIILLLVLDIIYSNHIISSPLYKLAGINLLVILIIHLGRVVLDLASLDFAFGCHF